MSITNDTMLKLRKMKVASEIVRAQIDKEVRADIFSNAEKQGENFKIIYKAVSEAVEEDR